MKCLKYVPLIILLVGLIAVMMSCSNAKHVVVPASQANNKSKGIYYALPRTVLVVDVPINVIEKKPGNVFDNIASAELKASIITGLQADIIKGLDISEGNIIKTKRSEIEIGTPIITTRNEPDPEKLYFIDIQKPTGWWKDTTFSYKLTEDGIITESESGVTDKSVEFAVESLKTVAGIASLAVAPTGAKMLAPPGKKAKSKEEEEVRRIIREVQDINRRRLDLISGVGTQMSNIPPEALTVMLSELDKYKKSLVEKITGTTTKTLETFRFEVRPPKGGEYNLFNIDGTKISLSETPEAVTCKTIPPGGEKKGLTDNPVEPMKVSLKIEKNEDQVCDKLSTPIAGERSYYYNLPATVRVDIYVNNDYVASDKPDTVLVSQMGKTMSLPACISSMNSSFKPVFHPSGSLKELAISGKSVDIGTIGKLGESLQTISEAQKAGKAEGDELAQLKRKAELLELQVKIKEAEEKLGQ